MKKLFLLFIVIALAFACNNTKTQKNTQSNEETITKIKLVDFTQNINNLIDKRVEITAMVKHVCGHGGKRMFLADADTEESIKIVVGENMAAFNTDLEGSTVKVIGIVEELRIDETYLLEWESEIEHEKSDEMHDGDGHEAESKGEEADQGDHKSAIESIADYRKQIAESGTDHLSFYSIICEKYEVITSDEN